MKRILCSTVVLLLSGCYLQTHEEGATLWVPAAQKESPAQWEYGADKWPPIVVTYQPTAPSAAMPVAIPAAAQPRGQPDAERWLVAPKVAQPEGARLAAWGACVSSFRDRSLALLALDSLRKRGISGDIVAGDSRGPVYRVVVGSFADREKAVQYARTTLKTLGLRDAWAMPRP